MSSVKFPTPMLSVLKTTLFDYHDAMLITLVVAKLRKLVTS